MKPLQYFNVITLLLCLTFFVTLGVVTLMYAWNLDVSPRMRSEWPKVSAVTAVFGGMSLISFAAFWSQRRKLSWRWPAQGLLVIALVAGTLLLRSILS